MAREREGRGWVGLVEGRVERKVWERKESYSRDERSAKGERIM